MLRMNVLGNTAGCVYAGVGNAIIINDVASID